MTTECCSVAEVGQRNFTNHEIILAGRPNSGKSTLFNRIAGGRQKVANYAGCTVEKKTASIQVNGIDFDVTDLPGLFSVKANSIDEIVALQYLEASKSNSKIVTVLDGNDLEHELVLPLLLKKQGYDVVVAVNMMDEVRANQKILNLAGMKDVAGIPFFGVSAKTGEGIESLKHFIFKKNDNSTNQPSTFSQLDNQQILALHEEAFTKASNLTKDYVKKTGEERLQKRTEKIDKILVHKIFGPIIFTVVMFFLFQSVFTLAKPMADGIDGFVKHFAETIKSLVPNELLASFLGDGLIAGVGAVVVFVPQIFFLFLWIAILELSGYLPRAAYMVDRLMKPFGLDGKVFIPLLSSMACAVPGIMSARTIENERTRLTTIMVAPLMTCSARLPVYTLLIAAFVPAQMVAGFNLQGLVMFAMYALSVVMALCVALLLRFVNLQGKKSMIDFFLLPNYRLPDARVLVQFVWFRVAAFLKKAGTIIATMAIVLWALLSFPHDRQFAAKHQQEPNVVAAHNLEYSIGGRLGKFAEPVFAPLGYDWKLSIAILGSLAAREVFVATLGTVFALGETNEHSESLVKTLQNAKKTDGSRAYTTATCVSLLLFFAFALQCISTIGIAHRETGGWRVPVQMFFYMFTLAYIAAFAGFHITKIFL